MPPMIALAEAVHARPVLSAARVALDALANGTFAAEPDTAHVR